MDYDRFLRWDGEPIDWDGLFGAQCVDEIAQYDIENDKPLAYANACDWWLHPALTGAFDFIENNPNDYNQVPPRGAIVIYRSDLPGSDGAGHIEIFDRVVSLGVFVSFSQNWGGMYCHFVTHGSWDYVIGWMVPKQNVTPQGGAEMIATTEEATKVYKMLRPNGGASDSEIQATAGNRSYAGFLNDAQPEIEARDANLRSQSDQLAQMQASINQLNQTVTAITLDDNAKKADLQEAITKVAKLTSELETAHDKIVDLQKTVPSAPTPTPATTDSNSTPDSQTPAQAGANTFITFLKRIFGIK